MGTHVGRETLYDKKVDNTIRHTQGDTLDRIIALFINDENGREVPFVPSEGDTLRFALKGRASDKSPIIKVDIPIDTMNLRIEAEEMEKIRARREPYWYDVEITVQKPDGKVNVDTVIEWTPFYVTEEAD